MPAPTPPEKVLAAARAFARENFGAKHRYVMVAHTHQHHPHVHLVVKAEREDGRGRLHIDKAMLREWREAFAQEMRRQGIAANATRRSVRGQIRRASTAPYYRTQVRGQSRALGTRVDDMVRRLKDGNSAPDPARAKLLDTRKAIVQGWNALAEKLEAQGEFALGREARSFGANLPPAMTDREHLTQQFVQFAKTQRLVKIRREDRVPDRNPEMSR